MYDTSIIMITNNDDVVTGLLMQREGIHNIILLFIILGEINYFNTKKFNENFLKYLFLPSILVNKTALYNNSFKIQIIVMMMTTMMQVVVNPYCLTKPKRRPDVVHRRCDRQQCSPP
jgi:hypothetical protein